MFNKMIKKKEQMNNNKNIKKVFSFCVNYFKQYGKFPKIIKIMNGVNVNKKELNTIFKYLLSLNKIKRKNNNNYSLVLDSNDKENINKTIFDKFFLFKIILFFVFLNFCYIGIKYNYIGNLKFKENIDALSSAIAFMFSAIIFFKLSIDAFVNKKFIKFVICIFIYILLFVYNTFTILNYQYDKYYDKIYSEKFIKFKKDEEQINLIDMEIKLIENQLNTKNKEKERQEKILFSLDINDKDYLYYFNNLNGLYKNSLNMQIKNLIKDLNKKLEEKNKIMQESDILKSKKPKFLTGILLNLYLFFPSFVIELLASITLTLLFYIKK